MDSLDRFDRPKPERLIHFPPEFQTTPCKPLLFDIARNQISGPDLSDRLRASAKGQGLFSKALSKGSGYFFGR